jgi:hypothetical protein
MRDMEHIIEGKIISNQIGTFGRTEFPYGYLTIEISPRENIVVKIDSYTKYETLEIGNQVVVEVAHLGTTDILVARKVNLKTGIESSLAKEEITTTT